LPGAAVFACAPAYTFTHAVTVDLADVLIVPFPQYRSERFCLRYLSGPFGIGDEPD
jgi:hypothetical protein